MRTVLGPAKDAPDVRLNGPFLPVHLLAWVVKHDGDRASNGRADLAGALCDPVQFVAVRKVRNNDDRPFAIEGSNFQLLRTFGLLLDPHVIMPFVCFICQLVDDLTIRGRNFYELFRKAVIDFRGRVDFASCMVREQQCQSFALAFLWHHHLVAIRALCAFPVKLREDFVGAFRRLFLHGAGEHVEFRRLLLLGELKSRAGLLAAR